MTRLAKPQPSCQALDCVCLCDLDKSKAGILPCMILLDVWVIIFFEIKDKIPEFQVLIKPLSLLEQLFWINPY